MAKTQDATMLRTLAKQVAALTAAVARLSSKPKAKAQTKPAAKAESGANPRAEAFINELIGEAKAGKLSAAALLPLCNRPEPALAAAALDALPTALKRLELPELEALLAKAPAGPARRAIGAATLDLQDYMAELNRLKAARKKK